MSTSELPILRRLFLFKNNLKIVIEIFGNDILYDLLCFTMKDKKKKIKKPKKIQASFTLDPEVVEKAEKLAEDEDRSVSSLINKLIKDA